MRHVASATLYFGVLARKFPPDVFGVPCLREGLYRIEHAHARRRFRGLRVRAASRTSPTESPRFLQVGETSVFPAGGGETHP